MLFDVGQYGSCCLMLVSMVRVVCLVSMVVLFDVGQYGSGCLMLVSMVRVV